MSVRSKGRIWRMRDDIDTDIIIPTQYGTLITIEKMSQHAFEPLVPEFSKEAKEGDIIVAGENFGCGSSREQAPEIISYLGVRCIIAKSFARIFYRNSINNGMMLIVSDLYDHCKDGDQLEVDMEKGILYKGHTYPIPEYPDNIREILEAGGLVEMMRARNSKRD